MVIKLKLYTTCPLSGTALQTWLRRETWRYFSGLCFSADSDLDQKMVENFVQEGIIMKNFNHPHVLSLLGLCLGFRKEPMVILPFMANGDLRTYVKDKSRVCHFLAYCYDNGICLSVRL